MPLTPRFSLRQSSTHIYVEISVPSFRLTADVDGGMEVLLMGENNSEFHFYARPYLLKLNFFPNGFVDQDNIEEGASGSGVGTAKYDPSQQTVTIPLLKQKLIQKQRQRQPKGQCRVVIDESNNGDGAENENNNDNDNGDGEENKAIDNDVDIDNDIDNDNDIDIDIDNYDDDYWPDLDLTARMIQPKEIPKKWLHSVIDESESEEPNGEAQTEGEDVEEIQQAEQRDNEMASTRNNININININGNSSKGDGYGFANMYRNIFTDYCRSGLAEEMLQLKQADPENSTVEERRDERHDHESSAFDFDRYLADLELSEESTEDYLYPMVLAYQPWWRTLSKSKLLSKSATANSLTKDVGLSLGLDLDRLTIQEVSEATPDEASSKTIFTDDEKLLLSTIPYPLLPKTLLGAKDDSDSTSDYRLWCGLLELILAYVYDHLTTMGDPTVESAWTVFVLSPGLSWLDNSSTKSVESTAKTFLRRVLVYPYWRNAEGFGRTVLVESMELLQKHGIHGVIKILVQIRVILEKSEVYYLGNKLLIDPFLYWIQNATAGSGHQQNLEKITSELAQLLKTDKAYGKVINRVEASLGIDVMMKEFFGNEEDGINDDDDDDAAVAASCTESDSDSSEEDSDDSSDSSGSDDKSNGDQDANNPKNEKCAVDEDKEDGRSPTRTVQLLDDEIGSNSDSLYCIGDEATTKSAEAATPIRPLITEIRSDAYCKAAISSLIQEL